MTYKQVIILRDDLDMSTGKLISQACHASIGAYRASSSEKREDWLSEGGKKVVLKVSDEEEFMDIYKKVGIESFPSYLVKDAGKTEIKSGQKTAIAIGPARENKIDKITKDLSSF